jgi:hypothetical protein
MRGRRPRRPLALAAPPSAISEGIDAEAGKQATIDWVAEWRESAIGSKERPADAAARENSLSFCGWGKLVGGETLAPSDSNFEGDRAQVEGRRKQ